MQGSRKQQKAQHDLQQNRAKINPFDQVFSKVEQGAKPSIIKR
jgi:hypothetical protein